MDTEDLDEETKARVDVARSLFDSHAAQLGLTAAQGHLWYHVREGLLEAVCYRDETRIEAAIMQWVREADRTKFRNAASRIYRVASRIPQPAAD
jgi:hypothetical protein